MNLISPDLRDKFLRVSYKDILHIFKFLTALPVALIYRHFRRNIWLFSEYGDEARDNAYWLFRYVRTEHPDEDAVYAINKNSPDLKKIESLGETVSYGALMHWIYYLAARVNISSQKGGKPNAAVCYLLEVYGVLKNTRVLLQHGIILNDTKYLYYKKTKISLFICGAKPEYNFVKAKFGYPENSVVCTGMCRYDALMGANKESKTILVVPTWRKWIAHDRHFAQNGGAKEFQHTDYYKKWNDLLNSRQLDNILKSNGLHLIFCPHRNMEAFVGDFTSCSPCIRILRWKDLDVHNAIFSSSLLVTDYSSISVDFAYTGKCLLYYQFDADMFHKKHLSSGYFDYARDGFGHVCHAEKQLIDKIDFYAKNGFCREKIYNKRASRFFAYIDDGNCERSYRAVKRMLDGGTERAFR